MSKALQAVFDGEVFRPEDKIGLRPNTRYRITVEIEDETKVVGDAVHPLTTILNLATDMGVTDLAEQHDHYAHGKFEEASNCGS